MVVDVELSAAILLNVEGDDIPARPKPGDGSDVRSAWRARYHDSLGLVSDDVPDGLHIACRAIVSERLLDAVIDCASGCAEQTGAFAPYLDGGATLVADGKVIARPGCCADLKDGLSDWLGIPALEADSWHVIWNGHPWVMARIHAGVVEVSEQSETPALAPEARIPVAEFEAAIELLQRERQEFCDRVEARLRSRGFEAAAETARTISGLAV